MKRRFRISIYVVVLHPLLSGIAFAQERPPLRLTLREAVKMALRQNPQVQLANLNVAESVQEGAAANVRDARSGADLARATGQMERLYAH
ncbi:MAG: hypothetical protein HYS33_02730 [Acidobacteria bacterium]|nr:hypothetical protein [Acidobacteriota bacterium]